MPEKFEKMDPMPESRQAWDFLLGSSHKMRTIEMWEMYKKCICENNYHIAVAILLLLVIIVLYILVYFVKGGISMKCVKGIYLLLHRKRRRRMLRTNLFIKGNCKIYNMA